MARNLETLQKQYNNTAAASTRGPMAATNNFKGKPAHSRDTIKRILSYVGKHKFRLVLVVIFMLLSTGASLAAGYVLRPVINHIADPSTAASDRMAYLAMMLGVMAGIYLIAVFGQLMQSKLMIGVSRNAIQSIRDDLFTRIERLPLRFHDSQTTGELMSRFTNDVDNIGQMLDQSLISMVSGIINLVGTLAMMVYTNIWLTMITLVFIPIFIAGSRFVIGKSRKYYAAQQAANLLGRPLRDLGLITCHLGNGGSITAVNHGKSIDTTMGFTPLEGLMMGTRSGNIDPAILTYIMRREGKTFDEMDEILNKESGILGISGTSSDMRDVLDAAARGDEYANLAIDMYVYRVQKAIGGYYAAMTRTDAVVMTAGIGENSADLRERIFAGLAHMGMILDKERNDVTGQIGMNRIISIDDSPIKICVVTTDEEMRIARETDNLVSQLRE